MSNHVVTREGSGYGGAPAPVSLAAARQLVPPMQKKRDVAKRDGDTADIVKSVLGVFRKHHAQGHELGRRLRGADVGLTLRNVFAFVRGRIQYELDPPGYQYIKTPAAVVHTGVADCKGLSILTAALLLGAGIPCAFRFAAYVPGGAFTHVYVVAKPKQTAPQTFVVDTCLSTLNHEKPPTGGFTDYDMSQIIHISGVGVIGDDGDEALGIHGAETADEFELKLHRQAAHIERNIVAGVYGPAAVGALNEAATDYDRALGMLGDPDRLDALGSAIGRRSKAARKARKTAKKAKRKDRKKRRGSLLKRVAKGAGKGLKKAGKLAFRAATLPQRLLLKGLGEVLIPKASPFFLYLFVTNPTTLNALPAKVKRKRKKAEKFAKFMTKVVGMKEAHFMKLVRNGIMKKYRATPEQVLAKVVSGPISGLGWAAVGEPVTIIMTLMSIIQQLGKVFGKKPAPDEMPEEGDAPDLENDFGDAAPKTKRLVRAEMQTATTRARHEEPSTDAEGFAADAAELEHQDRTLQQVEREPADTAADAPTPDELEEDAENFPKAAARPGKRAAAEPDAADADTPTAARRAGPTATATSNKALLVAGAAGAALWLLKK